MAHSTSYQSCWNFGQVGSAIASGMLFGLIVTPARQAEAQIIPDGTLGNEPSVLTPDVMIRGAKGDRIDGGALRGTNLFHSFSQFNVETLQRVYFSNPAEVQNILSRVTGGDPSKILGTLGVDGSANLFLINPRGIVFGPNARLDISGSFTASTAEKIMLGNGVEFSATNPNAPPLLTINIQPGPQLGDSPTGAIISSTGNLTTGKDLTLAADKLDLQGQLQAGGNLTLNATDTVKIRDTVAEPFVAQAGNQLLVQGNQRIDIFALNHPSSGLISGGDMVLRSASTVGGDAHYWSRGNFRIEQMDGTSGNLFSPYDPIIGAAGDVTLADYTGASLHILAGGKVKTGNITINAKSSPQTSIGPNPPSLWNSLASVDIKNPITGEILETITIDGSARRTLDIRAGIDWSTPPANVPIPNPLPNSNPQPQYPNPPSSKTDASIITGDLTVMGEVDNPSMVLLTNQYASDSTLQNGTITTGSIQAYGGNITIDARDTITTEGNVVSGAGNTPGGNITLLSKNNIDTSMGNLNAQSNSGNSGNISLVSVRDINANLIESFTPSNQAGTQAGTIDITSKFGNITTNGIRSYVGTFDAKNDIAKGGTGKGGNINLKTEEGTIKTTRILSFTGEGNGGNITLKAGQGITSTAIRSFVGNFDKNEFKVQGIGNAGDISLDTKSGDIKIVKTSDGIDGNIISAAGNGTGGNITLDSSLGVGQIKVESTISSESKEGEGGNISITASSEIKLEAEISSTSNFNGKGGNISLKGTSIDTRNGVITSRNDTASLTEGIGGDVSLNATTGDIKTGSIIASNNGQEGGYSNIFITSQQGSVYANNVRLSTTNATTQPNGTLVTAGTAGNIEINAPGTVSISNGSRLESVGSVGFIFVGKSTANNTILPTTVTIDKSSLVATNNSNTDINTGGGRIYIAVQGNTTTPGGQIDITNNSNLETTASNNANGGKVDLIVGAGGTIKLDNSSINSEIQGTGASSSSGINIQAPSGTVILTKSKITTSAMGSADASPITINAQLISLSNMSFLNTTTNVGVGGTIQLIGLNNLTVVNSLIAASTTGKGGTAGNVSINGNGQPAAQSVTLSGIGNFDLNGDDVIEANAVVGGIIATATNGGNAGTVNINTTSLEVKDGASVAVSSQNGLGTAGNIDISASTVTLSNGNIKATTDQGGKTLPAKIALRGLNNLTASKNSLISTSTNSGGSGEIMILANQGLNPFVSLTNSKIEATAKVVGGQAGGVVISTSSLTTSGSEISTSNVNAPTGGDITLTGLNSLVANNNSLISASTDNGVAGSLNLNQELGATAASLVILNNSQITVAAKRATLFPNQQVAGDILLNTQQLTLNNSEVSASTISGEAGNLTVEAKDANGGAAEFIRLNGVSTLSLSAEDFGVNVGTPGSITLNTRELTLTGNFPTERSVITATTTQGVGKDITLKNLNTLTITNGEISASTDSGIAGNLKLNQEFGVAAANSVVLTNSQITVAAKQTTLFPNQKVAGDILLNTQQLTLNSSNVFASTITGSAGNLTINANGGTADFIRLSGESKISLGATDSNGTGGNAGSITLNTRELTLIGNSPTEHSVITATTTLGQGEDITLANLNTLSLINADITASTGSGRAGNLRLNQGGGAANSTTLINSKIAVEATQAALPDKGNAGEIFLNTQNLSLTDSLVSASTVTGRAGDLTVEAVGGNIQLSGTLLGTQQGGLFAQATGEKGIAGNIAINTQQLTIQNGASITASNISAQPPQGSPSTGDVKVVAKFVQMNNGKIVASTETGVAGNILIDPPDTVVEMSNNSLVSVQADSGRAGNLTFNVGQLRLSGNSKATVSSRAGQAGNLAVRASSMFLDQKSEVTAKTGAGNGANIDIQISGTDPMFLRNGSLISADARGVATGGNITINAPFIIGIPQEDSDITANAEQGDGGRVNITSNGVFGLRFRPHRTDFSDITASSESGSNGTVNIVTLGIDPSQGLTALPAGLVDASQQVTQGCSARASGQGGRFTVTGRGGLPPTPEEALSSDAVWEDVPSASANQLSTKQASTNQSSTSRAATSESVQTQSQENSSILLTAKVPATTCYQDK